MRDLARQSLSRRRGNLPRSLKPILIILAVLVVGFFVIGRLGDTSIGGESEYLSEAPQGLTPVETGEVYDSSEGLAVATGSITLRNVDTVNGSATAVRTYVQGNFTLTVNATLPDPKGNPYQVWITNGTDVFDAGFMNGSGNSWDVTFRHSDNFMSYREVWITREITNFDDKPEKIIMKGTF